MWAFKFEINTLIKKHQQISENMRNFDVNYHFQDCSFIFYNLFFFLGLSSLATWSESIRYVRTFFTRRTLPSLSFISIFFIFCLSFLFIFFVYIFYFYFHFALIFINNENFEIASNITFAIIGIDKTLNVAEEIEPFRRYKQTCERAEKIDFRSLNNISI